MELYELCRKGDWAGAMARQRPLWNLNQAFAKHNLAACIKGGLKLQGYAVGDPVPPQSPASPEARAAIAVALADVAGTGADAAP